MDAQQLELDDLLRRAKAGEDTAREELFRRLGQGLRAVAAARLRGALARFVDDAVQDALVVVSQKLDEVHDNVHRYAYRCLVNKIGHVYSDPRNQVLERPEGRRLPAGASKPEPPDPLLRDRMERAASRLSVGDRELVEMLARGMGSGEIAALTPTVDRNAVYQRIHRCLKRFRVNLESEGVQI